MRVLLANHFPLQGSGSGIYTLNIAAALARRGHEVRVIDIDNVADPTPYPFERRTIRCDPAGGAGADLPFNFPCFTTHPRSLESYAALTDAQLEAYVECLTRVMAEEVAAFAPDVIHAQHVWVTPYAARAAGVPCVITVHGTDLMGFREDARYRPYALAGAAHAARLITISRQVHEDALALYGVESAKLLLNPNGFDAEIFKVREGARAVLEAKVGPLPRRLVSFVGKFTDFKGIDVLIDAARIVTDRVGGVGFALAGDGALRPEMEARAARLGLDNVHFLGHQPQEDVALLYNAAEVSTVPSRVEPFGLVAIEALACGTPVVATRAGGLPDFIDARVGALAPMEDAGALAEAIIGELEGQAKQRKGAFAAEYARAGFAWEATLARVVEAYEIARAEAP